MPMTYDEIRKYDRVNSCIRAAGEALQAMGDTEHGFAHVIQVAEKAGYILETLGYPPRTVELAKIAGYMHDIGNMVNRIGHSQTGGVLAFRILDELGFDPAETALIVSAIGNHDESSGYPVNPVAAALILADKSDMRRSRVRNRDYASFDIHDRVNYSVTGSSLTVSSDQRELILSLTIDTRYGSVMDYFEIFLQRMIFCRRAAEKLGTEFRLVINGQHLV